MHSKRQLHAARIILNFLCSVLFFLLCLQPGAVRTAHARIDSGDQANPGYKATSELEELHRFAEQGNADAQTFLGTKYFRGDGVPQNYRLAVYWFRKAAEQGDAHAMVQLAQMYVEGRGVPQNIDLGIDWFRKAAEHGHTDAQEALREYEGSAFPNG